MDICRFLPATACCRILWRQHDAATRLRFCNRCCYCLRYTFTHAYTCTHGSHSYARTHATTTFGLVRSRTWTGSSVLKTGQRVAAHVMGHLPYRHLPALKAHCLALTVWLAPVWASIATAVVTHHTHCNCTVASWDAGLRTYILRLLHGCALFVPLYSTIPCVS